MITTAPPQHVRWPVPRIWVGETAIILGGGPSLTPAQVQWGIDSGFRRIATNNAFLLDKHADALVWTDTIWWNVNQHRIHEHLGPFKITTRFVHRPDLHDIHVILHRKCPPAIALDPGVVTGDNTGHVALNIAVHFGVRRIILLGFDMTSSRGHNWHDEHTRHAKEARYVKVWIPQMEKAAEELRRLDIEVLNATPNSALSCFRRVELI